ncbi:MAG: LysR family transcriptional regulator [Microbacterium sp.]|nr:LysR family transcriptional regulator [Microbacterium sp.]
MGSRVVAKLNEHGHDAVAASRRTGVDTVTGEGLAEVLKGADVVVDTTQAPSYAPDVVMDFFTTSTKNQLAAEKDAGVKHHVALTVVGTDRPQGISYFHGKAAQERLIAESGVPYTLVHAAQFFEFAPAIVFTSTQGDEVRVADASIQPIAAEDVATAVGRAAAGEPVNGPIEVAGPEVFSIEEFIRRTFAASGDQRPVSASAEAPYFGAVIEEKTLLPLEGAQLASTTLDEWLAAQSTH